ncbi:MAG: VWA domain-containing protein, partial [Actinobacteria bacterium]|nr:VWA domain-containing protein [Actinomycetota bacterium]
KTAVAAVFAFLIFCFLLTFPFSGTTHRPENIFAQTSSQESDTGYDFVLVIDESGSMKNNDPQNLRIDAAKLFIYLAEILNKGNRALVAGFGEITNVYAPLTDISGNEKELSSAIDQIKSNQDLTDMKGALTKIKEILDNRAEKRKTIVIFLTDGSLTLEDIPPETGEGKTPGTEKKPGRTPGDGDGDDPDDGPVDTGAEVTGKSDSKSESGAVKTPGGYLEQYKKELLDLYFKYQYDGIVITPIAFTKESEVGLLEQMAFITGGVCLKPEKASDLRNSFLDILKNITSRFIRSEDQKNISPVAGEITMDDYIKEAVIISLKNSFNENPGLSLTDPGNKTGIYDEYIEEKIFKIAKIKEPLAGKWEYEINGDSIFIFDIIDSLLLQPEFGLYTLDAEIPFEIKILSPEGGDFKNIAGDLKISAAVEDPNGKITENIELVDSGTGKDSKQSDGIFSGSYSGSTISGYHNVSLLVQHAPTQSQSGKSMSYEAIKLPVKVTLLEPSGTFYGLGKEITIQVRVEQAGTSETSDRPFNLADYYISYNITGPQGQVSRELALMDNGKGPDTEAGDGIYSGIFSATSQEGDYRIDYFITDITKMLELACTGLKSGFAVGQVPGLVIQIENNLFAGEKTVVSANLEDYSAAELRYELK